MNQQFMKEKKCSSCITNIIKKIIWVVIGSTIAAFGIDLAKKHSWQIKYVRIALDVIVVLFGMLLGGKFGMCTICTILLSGVMIQKTLQLLHAMMENNNILE